MLPVIDPTGRATLHQIIISCAALWVVGLLPTLVGLSGGWYFAAAVVAGGGFLALGVRLARRPSAGRARALFLGSLVYLPLVMTLMLLDLAT
jgi:protoheme IX farnesyltransferase